jgi:hypothetical protein
MLHPSNTSMRATRESRVTRFAQILHGTVFLCFTLWLIDN